MNKPKWLQLGVFHQFFTHWNRNGKIYCNEASCGTSEDDSRMSVDHIVARHVGGEDSLSNLQPLCIPCNSRKNKYPDGFWSKRLYFDTLLQEDKLRVSQADFVMGPIKENAPFFAEPFCNINGKLLTFIQVVGAGKTLGMFALPFAINEAVKNHAPPGSPRVNKVLIITKSKSLRDQIAKELREEPTAYGIVQEAPIVEVIEQSAQLISPKDPDHHFAVMCPNMLWPSRDENADGSIESSYGEYIDDVLRRYQLINFDETHYAYANIKRFLKIARNNLVFGFTASPIDSSGTLLEDMVRASNYSYSDAMINDGSMKHISINEPGAMIKAGSEEEFLSSIQVVNSENHEYLGEFKEGSKVPPSVLAMQSVADALILKLWSLDNDRYGKDSYYQNRWEKYRHFDKRAIVIGDPFLAHGILVVSRKEEAHDFANYMNGVFRKDPARFPKRHGWTALAVYGGASPVFREDHPFFTYRNSAKGGKLSGKASSTCCRIIVVVDMAVEGMNNRFLCVTGVAKNLDSDREMVQRHGRATRVVANDDGHTLTLMPKSHDTAYVITHADFTWGLNAENMSSTVETIERSFDFILNSAKHTAEMLSLEEFIALDEVVVEEEDGLNSSLSVWQRWELAKAVGKSMVMGKTPRWTSIVNSVVNTAKDVVRRKAINFSQGVYNYEPEHIRNLADLLEQNLPDPYDNLLINQDDVIDDMEVTVAIDWLNQKGFTHAAQMLSSGEWDLVEANKFRKAIDRTFINQKLELSHGPKEKIGMICEHLRSHLETDVSAYVYEVVLHMFSKVGATDIADFDEGGPLDITEATHVLRTDDFKTLVEAYCRYKLIVDGRAIEIATVLKVGDSPIKKIETIKTLPKKVVSTGQKSLFLGGE